MTHLINESWDSFVKIWVMRKKLSHALSFSALLYAPLLPFTLAISEGKSLTGWAIGGIWGVLGFLLLCAVLSSLGFVALKESINNSTVSLILAVGVYFLLSWAIFITLLLIIIPVVISIFAGEDLVIFGNVIKFVDFGLLLKDFFDLFRGR